MARKHKNILCGFTQTPFTVEESLLLSKLQGKQLLDYITKGSRKQDGLVAVLSMKPLVCGVQQTRYVVSHCQSNFWWTTAS